MIQKIFLRAIRGEKIGTLSKVSAALRLSSFAERTLAMAWNRRRKKRSQEHSMDKALTALSNELKKVRTGRAQISMLDNIRVNYYGTPTPLAIK